MTLRRLLPFVFIACITLAACGSEPVAEFAAEEPTEDTTEDSSAESTTVETSPPATEVATTATPTTTSSTTTTTTTAEPAPAEEPEEVAPPAPTSEVSPFFQPVVEELQAGTSIPLRLPMVEQFDDDFGVFEDPDVYPNPSVLDDDHYTITIGFGPDCAGGNVCRIGTISGRRLAADESPLMGGVPVPLPDGRTGQFFDATCGANCGDGFVTWLEGDIQYTVGAKVAPGPDMLEWAWSALAPDQVAPQPPETCDSGQQIGDRSVSVVPAEGFDDFHWLMVCGPGDVVHTEVLHGSASLRPIETIDGVVALERDDGTMQFFNGGFPVVDHSYDPPPALLRLTIADLRCADTDGDGDIELIDADRQMAYTTQLPFRVSPVDPADIATFATC